MRDFSIDLVWAKLQMAIAAVGGWLGYFVGGVDGLMTALLVLMVMDYVTGIMCAVIDRELSSSVGFRGIFKKVLILMLVGVAHIVDLHVVQSGEALRSAVICFYLSNEGVSVLENAGHLGLPIPEKLKAILAQLHDRIEDALVLPGDLGRGEQAAGLHLRDAELDLAHELLVQPPQARTRLAGNEGAVEVGVESGEDAGLLVDRLETDRVGRGRLSFDGLGIIESLKRSGR